MSWQLLGTCVLGAVLQWLAMSFAGRLGERRGHHAGWCKGYEQGGRDAMVICARLEAATNADELRAIRDQMLAELETVKH